MMGSRVLVWLNMLPIWQCRVDVWGYRLRAISFDRLLALCLHRLGWMGVEEKAFFERWVRPGMHVVDVGANTGLYTLLLSRLVGDSGSVMAFEPEPELFACLEANCQANAVANVELHNVAAGSRSGSMVLSRSLLNAGDNRLAEGHSPGLAKPVDVRTAAIDAVIAGRGVDFVKIDVQGWEREVFDGMKQVLAANPALQICFEYWPGGLRRAGCDPVNLLRGLGELGFQIYSLSGNPRAPITDFQGFTAQIKRDGYTNLQAIREDASRAS